MHIIYSYYTQTFKYLINKTMKKYANGADIGGSHISCAVIDLEKESIIRKSFAAQKVDNQASADDILESWTIVFKKSLNSND